MLPSPWAEVSVWGVWLRAGVSPGEMGLGPGLLQAPASGFT